MLFEECLRLADASLIRGVVSLHPTYIKTISEYNRVRKQKTQTSLGRGDGRTSRTEIDDLLAPWNEQLVELGARIHKSRTAYIEQLNGAVERGLLKKGPSKFVIFHRLREKEI